MTRHASEDLLVNFLIFLQSDRNKKRDRAGKTLLNMEFKNKGNDALKAKDYAEAIKCYTQAIDSGEDADSLHVFYGNRSAAHLHAGDKDASLKDAKKCVSSKSDWPKGHSRLGAAFFAKNQMSMAKDAYQKAMELDPSSAAYKASFEDANKRDRINRGVEQPTKPAWAPASAPGQYAQQQGQFYVPPPASWTNGPAPASVRDLIIGSRANMMSTLRTVVHVLMVLMVPLFFVMGQMAHRYFFLGAITSYILNLAAHGIPKFDMNYGQKLVTDPSMHYLFYCIVFLSGRPKLLAMFPPLLQCLYSLCEWFSKFFNFTAPGMNTAFGGIINMVAPVLLGIPPPEWAGLNSATKWSRSAKEIPQRCASGEIAIGFLLIFELVQGMQGLLTMFMYWSGFLRLRFMISNDCKVAFTKIDATITSYTSKVGMVDKVYGMIKGAMASQVALPKPGEKPPSMMPKCTIM